VVATTLTGKMIAIVGPTASGKTDLALSLARKHGAEIICADSRTIYRGMDIGTAKPTIREQGEVPHHLLDIVDPGERLSAAAFKSLAMGAIGEIWERGRIPMLVGGSGLYLDSVLYDFQFPPEADPDRRAELDVMELGDLRELLAAVDAEAYERTDLANRRRVIRAIETAGQERSRAESLSPGKLVIGLSMSKEVAQERISNRVKRMLEQGFIEEVKMIGETYGWESPAMSVIGYAAFRDVILRSKTVADATADFVRGDMGLYKKQMTWFKRNSDIQWVENAGQAEDMVNRFKV
jgi:tRNA dimethylallyltransferase